MRHGTPFRAAMMMGMALAVLARQHAPGTALFQAGLHDIGPYKGRGKGKTHFHHGPGDGASKSQRSARKARNAAHHRRACRG